MVDDPLAEVHRLQERHRQGVADISSRGRDQDVEITILGDPLPVLGMVVGEGAEIERDGHRLGLARVDDDVLVERDQAEPVNLVPRLLRVRRRRDQGLWVRASPESASKKCSFVASSQSSACSPVRAGCNRTGATVWRPSSEFTIRIARGEIRAEPAPDSSTGNASCPGDGRCGYYDFLAFERRTQDDPEFIATTDNL